MNEIRHWMMLCETEIRDSGGRLYQKIPESIPGFTFYVNDSGKIVRLRAVADGLSFERPIATAVIFHEDENTVTVHGGIDKEYRRQGIASFFMKFVKQFCKDRNLTLIPTQPTLLSPDGQKFMKGMNYFSGGKK